jgi:hypothetical protein
MAEYRIRETGEIVMNLATQFPNTSLPMVLTEADCDALGIDSVLEGPQAQATQFQVAYRDGVEEIEGKWFTKYSVVDMEQEAIDALTAERWSSIRTDRNQRLADSDWTQLPDAPLTNMETENWGSYRQALRDITTQGDPFNIEWPVLPSAGG